MKEQKTGEINTQDYVQRILIELEKYYILPEKIKFIVGGDGDTWIMETASFLETTYVLDRFHFAKELKNSFLKGRKTQPKIELYNKCYNLFIQGKCDQLLEIAKIFKKTDLARYIRNHRQGIQNQKLEYNIGVSAESDISWFIKSTLGYGAKAYAYKTYKNLLYLKLAKMNKINVLSSIKKFYNFG
ncbi:UPF0236 family transposase-like protein [Spiroplasma sp. SV19]|uniref:UPF0236 family transposase-like protein n=1 Tax=Spiroplasma sp. SV19 TaxID=2570468 RepID=UPI0024B6957D|nr:UPF0236 family protein [Spiroplasma sp. SV19]WHQ37197.1 hypothetical protein E7Y35_04820 [Spiroplasma sp. SV19]